MVFNRVNRRPIENSPRILIVVQNLPVPLDRRVWLECQALRDAGYTVSVICPKGPDDPAHEIVDDVALYKYSPAPDAKGLIGFGYEFTYSWLRTAWLSLRVQRERGFDVLQACNPPDTYWALGLLWKLGGVQFVFDHHDLNPELFISRFGTPTSLTSRLELHTLKWLERRTFRAADHVISTNESYKAIAQQRGKVPSDRVTVVRSGPMTSVMRPVYPPPTVRKGADHLLVYLGIMGPQDGVEIVLQAMDHLVHRRGRTGVRAALLGFGDCLKDLQRQCTEMGLDPYVEFTGRAGPETVAAYLSAADVGLGPDPKTPLNDVSTMNKTMEYMSFALPSVAFDLTETRVSGADTVVYVPGGDLPAFVDAVEMLLDDVELRVDMAVRARRRVETELDWVAQRRAYLGAYAQVTGHRVNLQDELDVGPNASGYGPAAQGALTQVNLEDEAELRDFIVNRGSAGKAASVTEGSVGCKAVTVDRSR